MAERTGIEWADHTFNAWWGCEKVAPECKNCYAEEFAERFPQTRGLWGKDAPRKPASESYWRQPLKWDESAKKDGVRRRVFVNSMSDFFEARSDRHDARMRVYHLIDKTPNLIWMFLTKRPESFASAEFNPFLPGPWPENVWLGVTAGTQATADRNVPLLVRERCSVRYVSMEPLLEYVDMVPWLTAAWWCARCARGVELGDQAQTDLVPTPDTKAVCPRCGPPYQELEGWCGSPARLEWVIVGGESGDAARPMHPSWIEDVQRECARARVPFFFKQWGEWRPETDEEKKDPRPDVAWGAVAGPGAVTVRKVGKRAAGALLEGVEYRAVPDVVRVGAKP